MSQLLSASVSLCKPQSACVGRGWEEGGAQGAVEAPHALALGCIGSIDGLQQQQLNMHDATAYLAADEQLSESGVCISSAAEDRQRIEQVPCLVTLSHCHTGS